MEELLDEILAEIRAIRVYLTSQAKENPTHTSGGGISDFNPAFSEPKGKSPPPLEGIGKFLYGEHKPSDYVDMIKHKINGARIKDGVAVWVPRIEVANEAARVFIFTHGHHLMMKVCKFVIERGRITVSDTMFEDVLPYMERMD